MPLVFYLSNGYLLGMGAWLAALGAVVVACLKLRRRWRMFPAKVRWVHGALSVWMLFAALTSVELYFALCYDESDSFNMTNLSRRWFDRHIDPRQPFRDKRPFPKASPAGTKRIVFLGDSFTWAQGVANEDDRFSDRIAADLERVHPGEYSVNNRAKAGIGTREAVQLLREMLESGHEIRTVVYVICLNDIEDFVPDVHRVYAKISRQPPQFFLFRNTYFFNLLYFRAQQFTLPEVRGYFSFLHEYYAGEPWRQMQQELNELCDLCAEHQVDLRIAVFPFLHNLGPDYPFRDAHRKLVAYFQSKGIRVLDLEPALAPHAAEGLTVNRFDAHPNERAHKIAAEAMQAGLLDDLFD